MSAASKKRPQSAKRWKKGLRSLVAGALFALSALTHAAMAPAAGLSAHAFCVSAEPASTTSSDQAPDRRPAQIVFDHCDACAMAAAPILAARTEIDWDREPVTLAVSFARAFELIERPRAGEARSRAPPQIS